MARKGHKGDKGQMVHGKQAWRPEAGKKGGEVAKYGVGAAATRNDEKHNEGGKDKDKTKDKRED